MKAGVDDTGSGDFKGFSCILFTDDGAEFLEKRGREILSKAGLSEFHGSN